jgi:hypothetical protein
MQQVVAGLHRRQVVGRNVPNPAEQAGIQRAVLLAGGDRAAPDKR